MTDFSTIRYSTLFPVPLVTFEWPDGPEINRQLRESILAHEAKNSGISKSNQGGWHSDTGQLDFCGEAGRRLVDHIYALAGEATRRVVADYKETKQPDHWSLNAWVNVNRQGHFNKTHLHPGATWSGVYYVDIGEPDEPDSVAPLHLSDPCLGRSTSFLPKILPSSITLRPKPGMMVLFPSYIPHMVFPHEGAGVRISIAFNLRVEPYP